jgi:hypothetical protein
MNHDDSDLQRQLSDLSARLRRVEDRLGLPPVVSQTTPTTSTLPQPIPTAPPTRPVPRNPSGGVLAHINRAREAWSTRKPARDYSSPAEGTAAPENAVPTVSPEGHRLAPGTSIRGQNGKGSRS